MNWIKSRHCDTGTCVEAAWVKSGRCDTSSCVEAMTDEGVVYLRNSTDPGGPALRFTSSQWRDFVRDIQSGEFPDLPDGDSQSQW